MPSLVAEIGSVIERHMKAVGLIESDELSEAQRHMIAENGPPMKPRPLKPKATRVKSLAFHLRPRCAKVQSEVCHHDGRLHDLPELRRQQVRLIAHRSPTGHASPRCPAITPESEISPIAR